MKQENLHPLYENIKFLKSLIKASEFFNICFKVTKVYFFYDYEIKYEY